MTGVRTAHAGATSATMFAAMLDDAAIFPPGNAPMHDAVEAHRTWMASGWSPLVGPFICSAARWDELLAHLGEGPPLPLSITVPDGADHVAPAVARALDEPRVDLVSVEVAVVPEAVPLLIADAVKHLPARVCVFAELPWLQAELPQMEALAHAGIRLKIRTGGTRASAFPSEAQLGHALWTAVRGGLPFKLTAGLHDPVRHRDPMTGFEHHGYLNVVAATARALRGHGPVGVVDALAEHDAERVADEVTVAIDAGLADRVREYFVSFGTCSISDPVNGLLDLGLIEENRP